MCQSFGARLNTLLNHSTYLHRDSAIWVTLVHGEGGSSSLWFKQLAEFKKHYNVLLVDLRDHGDSKLKLKNGHPRKYTFDLITSEILPNVIRV